jgi:isopenicillin N synthase-like dioxygenase
MTVLAIYHRQKGGAEMQSEQHQDDGYGHLIPGGLTRTSVAVAKLPIIDFEPFLDGTAAGKREVAQGLKSACVDVGFFYLANHGVPQPIVDRAVAQARTFFALPLAEKMAISQRKTPGYPGFTPMGLDVDDPKARKRQEGFNMNLELPHDALVDPASVSFHHPNLWPQRPEGFRADIEAYFKEMDRLKHQLYAAFALALDLPEDFFEPELSRPFVNMRINHYAAQPVVEHHSDIGGRPHTDYCCFTILAQEDDVPGLQLVQKDGSWAVMPPVRGTFNINIGDPSRRQRKHAQPAVDRVFCRHEFRNQRGGAAGNGRRRRSRQARTDHGRPVCASAAERSLRRRPDQASPIEHVPFRQKHLTLRSARSALGRNTSP